MKKMGENSSKIIKLSPLCNGNDLAKLVTEKRKNVQMQVITIDRDPKNKNEIKAIPGITNFHLIEFLGNNQVRCYERHNQLHSPRLQTLTDEKKNQIKINHQNEDENQVKISELEKWDGNLELQSHLSFNSEQQNLSLLINTNLEISTKSKKRKRNDKEKRQESKRTQPKKMEARILD